MLKQTLRLTTVMAAIILMGAACGKKAAVTTNTEAVNLNTAVTNPVTNTVIPSGNTTGDFSTSTNTTTNTSAQTSNVTISAAGVSPKTLTVTAGTTVTFLNTDGIAHQVASNPHPTHTGLPGFDNTGMSESYSFTFSTAGSFGYHDHLDPTNTALQGTIIVQ